MSSIGVVVFRNSLAKPQVLQESVNNSANISNNSANKAHRREVVIVKKKQKIQSPPDTVSVTSLVRAAETGVPAKRIRLRDDIAEESAKAPTPLAVARRNARERNRVRQVNDGFSALRRHIPEEVAEAFETANSSRGSNKKLSKVETLRMAVEYIRNLESLLNIGHDKENTSHLSMESFPSPASSSPRDNSNERCYFSLNSPILDDDDIEDDLDSSLPLERHHYINMPAHDNYQLVSTPHLYEDDERGHTITPSSDLLAQEDVNIGSHLIDNDFSFGNTAEQFTVIDPHNNFSCNDLPVVEAVPQYEIKYADSLQAEISRSYNGNSTLSIGGITSGLPLTQEQYKFKEETSFIDNTNYNEIDLKKELPDIHVTPEDRKQFEETLKWWEEKTRQARPFNCLRNGES